MKNIFTDTLTKADDAFIEFGRMPKADEFWDKDPSEKAVIDGLVPSIGVWLIGWWLPLIAAFLIVGYLINWNWAGLW